MAQNLSFETTFAERVLAIDSSAAGDLFISTADGRILRSDNSAMSWSAILETVDPTEPITDIEVESDSTMLFSQGAQIQRYNFLSGHSDSLYYPARQLMIAGDDSLIVQNLNQILKLAMDGTGSRDVFEVDTNCGEIPTLTSSDIQGSVFFITQSCGQENQNGNLFTSVDSGASWERMGHWPTSVLDVLHLGGSEILIGSQLGLFRSPDWGTTWSRVLDDFFGPVWGFSRTSNGTLSCLFADYLLMSFDNGNTWTGPISRLPWGYDLYAVRNRLVAFGRGSLGGILVADAPSDVGIVTTGHATHRTLPYPNPARSSVTISLDEAQPTQIRIVNALGQVLFSQTVSNVALSERVIDVSTLPPGQYFVRLHTTQSVTTYPISVVR